jgi:GNAT superfamily N-acetyltransferase
VVGTIGLRDIGGGQGALRRLYVKAPYRGQGHAVAQQLLARLVQAGMAANLLGLYLATADQFAAALRFYEKNGFVDIDPTLLPEAFPRIPQETRFFHRALS